MLITFIREMQIKSTIKYHYILELPTLKVLTIANTVVDVQQLRLSHIS